MTQASALSPGAREQALTALAATPTDGELDVLVVGAGTGSDVAVALREGAGRVAGGHPDPRLTPVQGQSRPGAPPARCRGHLVAMPPMA